MDVRLPNSSSRLLRGLGILTFVIGVLALLVVYIAVFPIEPHAYSPYEGA